MHPAAHLAYVTHRVLPDVGAPASLVLLALVGLLICAGGLVALVLTRRPGEGVVRSAPADPPGTPVGRAAR